MAQILCPPIPKQWDVVRCYCDYADDEHKDNTHPALVLAVVPEGKVGNDRPLVAVARGTGVHDVETGRRRKIRRGEIPLNLELCKSGGLRKETKFCFSDDGVFVFPWDSEYFRWDPQFPDLVGEPLFGSLSTACNGFKSFQTILGASPELRLLEDVIKRELRQFASDATP